MCVWGFLMGGCGFVNFCGVDGGLEMDLGFTIGLDLFPIR